MRRKFLLPNWIPAEVWQGFEDMRKSIKAPLTDRARELTVRELLKLQMAGYDPLEVLDQSTQRGWRGVFPVHKEQRSITPVPQPGPDLSEEEIAAIMGKIRAAEEAFALKIKSGMWRPQ